jgi:glycine cleavage system H protein
VDFPDDLLFHPDHLWVRREDGGRVTVGISDHAQDQLGRVVYVDLPEPGSVAAQGEEMGAIESAKSVSDLISPVDGEVLEVNDALADDPAPLNDDPYGAGWLAVIKLEGELPDDLLSAEDYQAGLGTAPA